MTVVDWGIVAFALLLALWGYQHGLIVGAFSLGGFVAGAIAGGRLGPLVLAEGAESPYAPLAALTGAILIGGTAAVILEGVGVGIRSRIVRGVGTGVVDGLGGAALLAALGLGISWVAGVVVLNAPGANDLRPEVQRSAILKQLNDVLPPSGPILNALNRIDPAPRIAGPDPGVAGPDSRIARDPDVRRAAGSVVRVLGTACGLNVQGSGWMAGDGLVVTNAHVVAGQSDTTVQPNGGPRVDATAVHYEPRNDLAILRADGLDVPRLDMTAATESGTPAAVVGFPENGPLTISPSRIGATETVISQDSYGAGPVEREMTVLRGEVRSGNSGGPAVDAAGRTVATLFASTVSGPAGGYAVPNDIVRRALRRTGGPVSTGPCTR